MSFCWMSNLYSFYIPLISSKWDEILSALLQDIEFMEKKIDDCEKVLKRSNAKEAKMELECCQKVRYLLKRP